MEDKIDLITAIKQLKNMRDELESKNMTSNGYDNLQAIKYALNYLEKRLEDIRKNKTTAIEPEESENDNVISNIVYIETKINSIYLKGIRPEDIKKEIFDNGDLFINFGNKVSIKSDHFISYEICDYEKNE